MSLNLTNINLSLYPLLFSFFFLVLLLYNLTFTNESIFGIKFTIRSSYAVKQIDQAKTFSLLSSFFFAFLFPSYDNQTFTK